MCTSRTYCLVAGAAKIARFNGAAWTVQPLPFATDGAGPELSCVGQTCVVAAETPVATIADTLTDGHWTGQKIADSNSLLGAVSCPTTSFCVALGEPHFNTRGNPGGLFAEKWRHGTWTGPVYLHGGVARFAATGDLVHAISCASATFCLAGLTGGPVWRYNGRSWFAVASPPAASPGITGVTCAHPTFCVATVTPSTNSEHRPTSSGVAVFNGSRWTVVKPWAGDTGHWQYDTCASPTFCMLSDDFNHFAVFNGKSRRQLRSPIRTPGTEGHGFITCTYASFCAMTQYENSQGYPITSGVDIFNGRSWNYHDLSSGGWVSGSVFNQAACAPQSRFCIAMDYAGRMVSYDGSRWSRMAVTNVGHAQIVCPSSKFCLAVDGSGAAIGT